MSKTFFYQPGPAGSGKTYQLSHWSILRAQNGEKVLIAQPTKELIRDTASMIRRLDPAVKVTTVFGQGRHDRVTSRALGHMAEADPLAGEVLLITHETLKRIPPNLRKFWHMVCDEVPSVLEHIDLAVTKTHGLITQHIATEVLVPGLLTMRPGDRTALEAVQINESDDQNIATFDRLANTILSGEHLVVTGEETYTDLVTNPDTRQRLDVFAILLPDFVADYRTTTFMGANIEDTEMFVIWSALFDIAWKRHPDMGDKLRYEQHQNGARLTLTYLFDGKLSKRFFDGEDDAGQSAFDRVTDFVARYWADLPFLWQVNSGAMPGGFDYDARLPGVSHGLDKAHWKRYHNVALLAAMNHRKAAYGFLAKIGISADQVQATLSWQNDYQAMMRCSLRDPDAVAPVQVIVGSKAGAEWIAARFPGCEVRKADHDIAEPAAPGRKANPDKAPMTSAERVRLHRARKKAGVA